MCNLPQNLRLLAIDDEESIRLLIVRALSRLGAQVDASAGGQEALARLENASYDLIICDLWMPEMSGQVFYDTLLCAHPSFKRRVIFITGDSMSEDAAEFLRVSGCLYLIKPFSLQALYDTINLALDYLELAAGDD